MQHEEGTYLYLAVDQSHFLFPITDVQEVSEMLPIRPYPLSFSGHLGVVNLRGQVIPVVSIPNVEIKSKNHTHASTRLIIARSADVLFAFSCTSVKKVLLKEGQLSEITSARVTNVENKPAELITASYIISRGAA